MQEGEGVGVGVLGVGRKVHVKSKAIVADRMKSNEIM